MTTKDVAEKADELVLLVAPWLPDATVKEIELQTSCSCYSEYTQEPCHFRVVFRAPRPDKESDIKLSHLVSLLEKVIQPWADAAYSWQGCSSCCDEGHYEDAPRVDVRVVRR